MATKNTKPPKPPGEIAAPSSPAEASADINASPAKAMQEQSIAPPEPAKISVTLRTEQSYEYNLDLPRPVVEKLLNPDVPDGFIEVPAVAYGGQRLHGTRRFLHTAYIKEVDVRGGME